MIIAMSRGWPVPASMSRARPGAGRFVLAAVLALRIPSREVALVMLMLLGASACGESRPVPEGEGELCVPEAVDSGAPACPGGLDCFSPCPEGLDCVLASEGTHGWCSIPCRDAAADCPSRRWSCLDGYYDYNPRK